ncbi:hypothetical protein [Actinomadura rugatobispora]|uniref:Flagellar biosynthetic protein FliP n=1 Tax=Actinomadura rugatobispora TaxID=1994 RepID=A0ABW1A5N8_9ACTN|nr:hypothetical protein GCM10010200_029580 [Actinomadura rugatobispora]
MRIRTETRHFFRHYLEMVAAMFVGMAVLGGAVRLAGVNLSAARHPELVSLEMAFDMAVAMIVWMRYRGHRWTPTLEMAGAMFVPALALFPLLWTGVITAGSLLMIEHVVMLPLMYALMLLRREEYSH